MSYVKKDELALWRVSVGRYVFYVTAHESKSGWEVREIVANARLGDVITVDNCDQVTSMDMLPNKDRPVDICQGGKSQYVIYPTLHGVTADYVNRQEAKRLQRLAAIAEKTRVKDDCDGEIVTIKGKQYKLTKVP